jgi:hypothetical protein
MNFSVTRRNLIEPSRKKDEIDLDRYRVTIDHVEVMCSIRERRPEMREGRGPR